MRRPSITDRLLARHWISHPEDSAYEAAKHMRLPLRTVQLAAARLRNRIGTGQDQLLDFLMKNPIEHKSIRVRHPNPNIWLRKPPVMISLSGEDAAAVNGWDIVPNRHTFYVEEKDLGLALKSLLDSGGRLSEKEDQNIILKVRDKWLMDEPAPLVERGQRLIDYQESRNIQLLAGLEEGRFD